MAFPLNHRIALLTALAACTPTGGDDTTTSTTSTTDSASDTGVPTTGPAPATSEATTSTSGTTAEQTTAEQTTAEQTTAEQTTAEQTTDPTSETTTNTTGEELCTLEHHAEQIAGQLGDFEDCGQVGFDTHDAAAWQAAHDCALAAATSQTAFKLVLGLEGLDSDVRRAYVAQEARSYAISALFYDSCTGLECAPGVQIASCAALTATPDCTALPGVICLTCVDQGEAANLCGAA